MSVDSTKKFRPNLLELERREVPAVSSVRLAGGVLTVRADNTPTTAIVIETGNSVLVRDILLNRSWSFSSQQIRRIDVFGGNGNDNLTARTNTILARLVGGNGDDLLLGGNNGDILHGGNGNDTIRGGGGDDFCYGGNGNDWLYGDNGNDYLEGGQGDDQLNGGAGINGLYGGAGKDTLITLNGQGGDLLDGGDAVDTFWMDPDDRLISPLNDVIHRISSFSNTGADLTLDGDRIPDPTPLPGDQLEVMVGRPLFSSQGPSYLDISQGQLGDCWLLAGFGAIAKANPDLIRQRVVDFGDGTYGVRLGDNFYRVDNDLPVAHVGNTWLQYTAFGREGSIWVAILEKAYTHYRFGQPTYGNPNGPDTYGLIEGGFTYDVFPAFGLDPQRVWFNPSTSLNLMSNTIRLMIDQQTAATIGFDFVPSGSGIPIIQAHQYILLGYTLGSNGLVNTITLRNPWGYDGPGSAPGPGNDPNFNDGIVTITLDQLAQTYGSFEWAHV
jgi:hypothetical protein